MNETLSILAQLGIGGIAVVALLFSIYANYKATQWKHDIDLKHEDNERARAALAETQQLADNENRKAYNEVQKLTAINQQLLIEQQRESSLVINDNTRATRERSSAALEQAKALDRITGTIQMMNNSWRPVLELVITQQTHELDATVKETAAGLTAQISPVGQSVAHANDTLDKHTATLNDIANKIDTLPSRFKPLLDELRDEIIPSIQKLVSMGEKVDQMHDVAGQVFALVRSFDASLDDAGSQVAAIENRIVALFERVLNASAPPNDDIDHAWRVQFGGTDNAEPPAEHTPSPIATQIINDAEGKQI